MWISVKSRLPTTDGVYEIEVEGLEHYSHSYFQNGMFNGAWRNAAQATEFKNYGHGLTINAWKEINMTKFDPTKPVQTRDGRKARIICTDRAFVSASGESWPIIALISSGDGKEHAYYYQNDGGAPHLNAGHSLVNIPEVKKQYRLVSFGGVISVWSSAGLGLAKDMLRKTNEHNAGGIVGISETIFIDGKITEINFISVEK
jgi:hypothetical protein